MVGKDTERTGNPELHAMSPRVAERWPTSVQAYVVRSLASTLTRRGGRDLPSAPKTYAVFLDAWSCSCAGFALDAFAHHEGTLLARDGRTIASPVTSPQSGARERSRMTQWDELGRSFGGTSLDGRPGHGEDVPCCKHLLACVLADLWGSVLGTRVEQRKVTKEELAGIMAKV